MFKKIGSYIIVFILGVGITCTGIYIYISGSDDNTKQFENNINQQTKIIADIGDYFRESEKRNLEAEELIQRITKGTIEGSEITRKLVELERANLTELQELKRKIQALETME